MKPLEQVFGKLTALSYSPVEKPKKALVLLHGVGSNERDLLEMASKVTEDRMVVSLRGPLVIGLQAFAWFHVQFTPAGPVHNYSEAKASFLLIEAALADLSKKTGIAMKDIAVLGFSQGAIMTIGLALNSKLDLERYIASSGRTLPEFAATAKQFPLAETKGRKVFLNHGIEDATLPVQLGRSSEKVLRESKTDLKYKEYPTGHSMSSELLLDIKKWISSP